VIVRVAQRRSQPGDDRGVRRTAVVERAGAVAKHELVVVEDGYPVVAPGLIVLRASGLASRPCGDGRSASQPRRRSDSSLIVWRHAAFRVAAAASTRLVWRQRPFWTSFRVVAAASRDPLTHRAARPERVVGFRDRGRFVIGIEISWFAVERNARVDRSKGHGLPREALVLRPRRLARSVAVDVLDRRGDAGLVVVNDELDVIKAHDREMPPQKQVETSRVRKPVLVSCVRRRREFIDEGDEAVARIFLPRPQASTAAGAVPGFGLRERGARSDESDEEAGSQHGRPCGSRRRRVASTPRLSTVSRDSLSRRSRGRGRPAKDISGRPAATASKPCSE